jgi:transcriptional repressor NrdR
MKCIFCGSDTTKVTDKRESPEGTRRRRECLKCKKRFTTYEKPDKKDIMIVKKDGRREKFSYEKLRSGVIKACEKRPISIKKIDEIIEDTEERLRRKGKEVKSEMIGKIVMNKLKKLDKIAYIRFASVYLDFQDVADFKREVRGL